MELKATWDFDGACWTAVFLDPLEAPWWISRSAMTLSNNNSPKDTSASKDLLPIQSVDILYMSLDIWERGICFLHPTHVTILQSYVNYVVNIQIRQRMQLTVMNHKGIIVSKKENELSSKIDSYNFNRLSVFTIWLKKLHAVLHRSCFCWQSTYWLIETIS